MLLKSKEDILITLIDYGHRLYMISKTTFKLKGIIFNSKQCPNCLIPMKLQKKRNNTLKTNIYWRCSNYNCSIKYNILTGSILNYLKNEDGC